MLSLPTLVGTPAEVELAGGDEHLLQLPVERVAVDIEIVDGEPGDLTLVDAEARLHLDRVQEPDVAQRCEVGFDLSGRQGAELDILDDDVIECHRLARRDHVAIDIRRLAVGLIGFHDE